VVDEVYQRLRKFLDALPGGFPESESGVELRILRKLFSPEEAEMELHMRPAPEPPEAIAVRAGMDEGEAATLLESMAKQGLIYRIRFDENVLYMAIQFVVGIYEFHLNTMDRELAEMFEEYLPNLEKIVNATETKQHRVVPVGASIEETTAVATYESVSDLVENQELIAVAPCICRKEQGLLDNPCKRPHEVCFTFGMAAEYYIENGLGREVSVDEAKEILVAAEEAALVLAPTNAREILNLCCCCKCCCGVLRVLGKMERPADIVQSSFQARIDPDACNSCGECYVRCQIDAIVEGERTLEVDEARCIGCGLCVTTCPEDAIEMVRLPDVPEPPANIVEMNMRIAQEQSKL